MVRQATATSYEVFRKIVVGVTGLTVLVVGIVMVVLPGPAVLVIPLGLGILAAEFAWAQRWLDQLRNRSGRVLAWARGSRA